MGGMAAQIPIKNDPAANEAALEKVRNDKLAEVKKGHDGTWVAHPALVPIAKAIFDEHMPSANQIDNLRSDVSVSAEDLLEAPKGTRTEAALRHNIRVGIQYIEAWLRGNGCVPLYHLMEDAATAEISRTQIWQWVRHGALEAAWQAQHADEPETRQAFATIAAATRSRPFSSLQAFGKARAFSISVTVISPTQWRSSSTTKSFSMRC